MTKNNFLSFLFVLIALPLAQAQLSDIARIDYTYLPAGDSNIEYNRFRGLFNYPIKLKKEKTYLLLGLDYSNIDLLMDNNASFNTQDIDDFQLLDLNIGYTTPLKNNWRLGIRLTPGVSSNLAANHLSFDDLVFSGNIVFIKDKKNDPGQSKPWRLILGVSYSGNRGINFPIPFISYYKKLNPKWSYNFGVPKTNLQHHFSKAHRLKLYAELDGFTSNLQNPVLIDGVNETESINMSIILGGLQYEYHITKHLQLYARASRIFNNSVNLRDKNRDKIRSLDNSNKIYLRTGIRLKI